MVKRSAQVIQQLSGLSSTPGCLRVKGWVQGDSPPWGPQPGPFHSTLDCVLRKGTMSGNRGISAQNTAVGHHRILSCKILNPTNTSHCQGENKGRERNPGGMSVHKAKKKDQSDGQRERHCPFWPEVGIGKRAGHQSNLKEQRVRSPCWAELTEEPGLTQANRLPGGKPDSRILHTAATVNSSHYTTHWVTPQTPYRG